jgi:starvation-inducible DNA-binding protein
LVKIKPNSTSNKRKKDYSMKPDIELAEMSRGGAVAILSALLADEFVLGTRTRNYHWNVTGPHFHDLHKLFGDQYDALDGIMDDMAERVRALGEHAVGTLAELLELARLKEQPGKYPNAAQMTAELLSGHEAVIRQLRGDLEKCGTKFGDAGTTDFLTGLMEQHEKMAWMLRSILDEKN